MQVERGERARERERERERARERERELHKRWTYLSAHGAVDGDDDEALHRIEHRKEDLGGGARHKGAPPHHTRHMKQTNTPVEVSPLHTEVAV